MHKPMVGRSDLSPAYWFATCNRGCCREDVDIRFMDYGEALLYAKRLVSLAEDGPDDQPLGVGIDLDTLRAGHWQQHWEVRS